MTIKVPSEYLLARGLFAATLNVGPLPTRYDYFDLVNTFLYGIFMFSCLHV